MKLSWIAGGLLALAGAAQAAGQTYQVQGTAPAFVAGNGNSFMEIWGVGSNSRYANPGTDPGLPFSSLIAGADAATQAATAGFASAVAKFAMDPAALPLTVAANGNSATYASSPVTIDVAGGPSFLLSAPQFRVGRSTNLHTQTLSFGIPGCTCDGLLAGNTFSFAAAPEPSVGVDLKALLASGAGSGFDLSGFSALPIRLQAPTAFNVVYAGVILSRTDAATNFGITPPASLLPASAYNSASFSVAFDGLYGVSVAAADYASNADFLAAQSWVTGNIRQINYESGVTWTIDSISAVPEPNAAWLFLIGLLPVAARAGRRDRTSGRR